MIAIAFLLFGALIIAWLMAPGGKPVRRQAHERVIAPTELVAHA